MELSAQKFLNKHYCYVWIKHVEIIYNPLLLLSLFHVEN